MLAQVHFEGIKSLVDVTVDLARFAVLVGPNGCGKTTVLDQIALLCQMTRPHSNRIHTLGAAGTVIAGLDLAALRTAGPSRRIVWRGVSSTGDLASVGIDPTRGNWVEDAQLTVTSTGGSVTNTGPMNDEALRQRYEAAIAGLDWRAQRLALIPAMLRSPSTVTLSELTPEGYGLPTVLKDLAANDTTAYLALQEDLARVVPHFRKLRLGKAGEQRDPRTTLTLVTSQGEVPSVQVSDGTLLALAVLTVAHNRELPPLVLIDDLDHGLHLSAQHEIVKAIRAAMESRPDLQVVCTTHSPFAFDQVPASDVHVMALDAQGHTRVKRLDEHPRYEEYRGYRFDPGQFWATFGEEWVLRGA